MKTLNYFDFSENDEENIFKNFYKNKKILADDVETVQKWMKTQPHLPEILDNNSIKNFLLFSKCSVEVVKQKIEWRYLIRKKIPDVFENINPRLGHMKGVFDAVYWVPLPKLTEDMGRVFISKVRNPTLCRQLKHHYYNGHHCNFLEIYLKESLQLNTSIIFDLAEINNENFKNFVPSLLRKIIAMYQNIYTIPVRAVYLVNSPPNVHIILSVLKTLLKPKLMQRIHFCNSVTEVLDIFPKRILPIDYGGKEKPLEELNEMIKQKFLEYQHRFDEIENFVIDENSRPNKLTNDDFLGFYGNFKKLDID